MAKTTRGKSTKTDADSIIIPGANRIALGAALAEEFVDLQRGASRNVVQMAVLANAVRDANKNQSGAPTKEFNNWFNKFGMESVFGTRSTFSKYATAGAVILKHKAVLGRDLSQLPLVVSALYEIHDLTDEELSLCLENTYTRDSNTLTDRRQFKAPKKARPVINAQATAKSIKSWKEKWRNPPVPKTDKRTVPFITITADATIYDFDKNTASPAGKTTIEQLRKIESAIAGVLKGHDANVRMKSDLNSISDGIERRRKKAEESLSKKKTRKSKRNS